MLGTKLICPGFFTDFPGVRHLVTDPNETSSAVVLVVEDEVLVRTFATDFLVEAGFKVFEAVNADEALTVLQSRADVHAVVTDVEMPGSMSGVSLAEAVRERWPGIAVIITSGRDPPEKFKLSADVPFIRKPYLPATIVSLLSRMVSLQIVVPERQEKAE